MIDKTGWNGNKVNRWNMYAEMIVCIVQKEEKWEYRDSTLRWDYTSSYGEWKKMTPEIEFKDSREFRTMIDGEWRYI